MLFQYFKVPLQPGPRSGIGAFTVPLSCEINGGVGYEALTFGSFSCFCRYSRVQFRQALLGGTMKEDPAKIQ
jgi:hypothetical protein